MDILLTIFPWNIVLKRKNMYIKEAYEKSMYLPLNFTVNLETALKIKVSKNIY